MSILGKSIVFALLAVMSTGSSAVNLYQPGSIPAQMFEVVKPVVGDTVTPVFLFGDNAAELMGFLNPVVVQEAGIGQATFDYFVSKLIPDSQVHGVVGYAIGGFSVPGNESVSRTCAIVMASHQQMQTTTTMFHEAVHCKNFAELRVDNEAWKLAASMNRPELGMSNNQFMSLFHEVLAAYIQVAYNSNLGIKDGLGMVIRAAQPDKNTATSIGYRTARSALKMCEAKGACSTHAPDVVRMLNSNSYARAQMMLDLKELFDAAKASGYIVENH
ncbi:hypothetical protein [Pseudomonas helleri]|uniref:Uncharacterized protein n=1 Tax=Pseudomonas helleri TaxID=1608996 RepID=A0A7X1Y602_9PSED|nr:hypothetical protein [Pseudomonas helleri]MQT93091.1 hypothetical protein [Pseudomonas helleri]MQU29863.1 hypothetical protein [Pseudomonas helleri]